MTRDRLHSFTYRELIQIAKKGSIVIREDFDKESLVNILYEALKEEQRDREELNNLAMQIESSKYTVSLDEELSFQFMEEIKLPERYHETCLVLMLRDPAWVFTYWDIEDRILNTIKDSEDFRGLVLRVKELSSPDWRKKSVMDWFDIPIKLTDFQRYINLPGRVRFYGVELLVLFEGKKEESIIRSNIVKNSPKERASVREEGDDAKRVDLLVELSEFSPNAGDFSDILSEQRNIPQRILDYQINLRGGRNTKKDGF